MQQPKRTLIVLEALEPISHSDTLTGIDNSSNTRLFMRTGLYVHGKPARVPDISENSLRTRLFRIPIHDHLVQTLGIEKGTLPQAVMNLLYSGGNVASGAKAPSNEMDLGHQVRRLYPSLELLGGAVDNFILPRSRLMPSAWILAQEYAPFIAHVAPDLASEAERVSIWDLLFEETRTRGTGDESAGNQMLYSYEVLATGSKILLELTLDAHTSPACAGAIPAALESWDGYFAGQARQGRGRMAIVDVRGMPDGEAYLAHLAEHGEAMRAGLLDGTLGTKSVLCGGK